MPRLRFGRFELQVRLVLVLLLLFLGVLDLLNIFLLGSATTALEHSERHRAASRIAAAASALGTDILKTVAEENDPTGLSSTAMRRTAVRLGYDRLALLDRAGREVASSGPRLGPAGGSLERLSEDGRSALDAGRTATGPVVPARGGDGARILVYEPLLDAGGRLVGILEGVQPVPELGRMTRNYRLVLAVQVIGVLLIAGLVVAFANWISRPYRRLAAAVGEAGLADRPDRAAPEPDELAAAFRAVVHKLRQQDETLTAVGQEGGGLGDLVRFANKAALGMTTGVLVVDKRARVVAANPAAAGLLGLERDRARGRDLDDVARGIEGMASRVRDCLERGVSASREVLEVRGGATGAGHLGVSISPAGGFEGEVAGALVLMTDLTEIRQLQEQARLRENLAAVGRLSAGIAHEFRNALGTILGYARMLEKEEDPRIRRPAAEILREIDAARSTVDEFLLYARPPEPTRAPVPLGAVVRACAAAVADFVEVEVAGEFGVVSGDDTLLRRVFNNLLRNAADAVADSGRKARVRITGRPAGSGRTIQIDVEDDGPGIPPEQRDQVFVPFFTTRTRGTGLGLALVQRTIVDLGGTIEVGQGTLGGALFRIRLPALPPT